MKFSQLSFKESIFLKGKYSEKDKSYLDFIIDGVSLSKYLGDVDYLLTPYGWENNEAYEISNAERLINFKKSEFENGLQSAYVCACCGDEGCGAVMFEVVNHGGYVEWRNFVFSDGYPTDDNPEEHIKVESLYFEIGSYQKSIGQLKSMILG